LQQQMEAELEKAGIIWNLLIWINLNSMLKMQRTIFIFQWKT
jgi:hypothetical protein